MSRARDPPKPKIGAGHAAGMARQGLRELRQALYPESNVAQATDYGIWGVATPGEVAEQRREDARGLDEECSSILEDKLNQASLAKDELGRDDKDRGFTKE